jgi:hypothetical protein
LCINLAGAQEVFPEGMLSNEDDECFIDFCPNIDELQVETPLGYEKKLGETECTKIPLEDRVIYITELLPNAPSVDTGQEFIELYNPNSETISLAGYKIQVGPSFLKEYRFIAGDIDPNNYIAVSDTQTGIVLSNSTGVQLRLISPAGNTVSESGVYSNADDDVSWALVEDQWIFTNQITRESANKPNLITVVSEVEGITSVYAPCPAGKFRNPETNRCKTIETAVSLLTPCDENEFRNPETNRCKKISSSTSSLVPCKEGQERNPETNRCRNVSVLGTNSGDLPTISEVVVENTEGQISWGIICATILATVGYMLYEWRTELQHRFARFK